MSLGIALYAFAVAIGVVISGGIIEISENDHTQNIQSNDEYYNDHSYTYRKSCLESPYYPCESNISINVGDDQSFSIYPNLFPTWKVDDLRVMAVNDESYGQSYIAYTYTQNYTLVLNPGIHKIEVNSLINKYTWYLTVINTSENI